MRLVMSASVYILIYILVCSPVGCTPAVTSTEERSDGSNAGAGANTGADTGADTSVDTGVDTDLSATSAMMDMMDMMDMMVGVMADDQAMAGVELKEDMMTVVDLGDVTPERDMEPPPVDVDMEPPPVDADMGGAPENDPLTTLPGTWFFYTGNPVLSPSANAPSQGRDNIYAPHLMRHEGRWWMWYGGQGSDGDDAIFLAWSDDLVTWSNHGGATPIPVVDHGASNHVNDPTVVRVGQTFYMYYTEAPIAEQDEIHLATSEDGISWQKRGAVVDVGAPSSWEPDRVGRPSVIYEEGEFRMWYDGQVFGVARHVGYATSPDGFSWTKHPDNPIVLNEGAIDVARVGSGYVMLAEGHRGIRYYTSSDRLSWVDHGLIIELSGASYDSFGQVTPHLVMDGPEVKALFYGGATASCWCTNRIAAVFPQEIAAPVEDQACRGCLGGFASCTEACDAAGFGEGICAEPNSDDPDRCCACSQPLGCGGCLQGFESCAEACRGAGFSDGTCAEPGSDDPGRCCACF